MNSQHFGPCFEEMHSTKSQELSQMALILAVLNRDLRFRNGSFHSLPP